MITLSKDLTIPKSSASNEGYDLFPKDEFSLGYVIVGQDPILKELNIQVALKRISDKVSVRSFSPVIVCSEEGQSLSTPENESEVVDYETQRKELEESFNLLTADLSNIELEKAHRVSEKNNMRKALERKKKTLTDIKVKLDAALADVPEAPKAGKEGEEVVQDIPQRLYDRITYYETSVQNLEAEIISFEGSITSVDETLNSLDTTFATKTSEKETLDTARKDLKEVKASYKKKNKFDDVIDLFDEKGVLTAQGLTWLLQQSIDLGGNLVKLSSIASLPKAQAEK